jgi:hypothetical protein
VDHISATLKAIAAHWPARRGSCIRSGPRWGCVALPDTDAHLKAFAGELREAVVAESPERVERVLIDWQAVAEVRAGERST